MRNWLIKRLGGIPMEEIKKFTEYKPHKDKIFKKSVLDAMSSSFGHHPEYRKSTLDKYFLASFAKRFIGNWIRNLLDNN